MKYLQNVLLAFYLACGIFACGTTEQNNNAEINIKTTEIDFGELE